MGQNSRNFCAFEKKIREPVQVTIISMCHIIILSVKSEVHRNFFS